MVLFPNPDVSEIFLSHYINYKKPFFVESSAIPQLTGMQAGKYSVIKPSMPEQKQIASILSDADARIDALRAHREKLVALRPA